MPVGFTLPDGSSPTVDQATVPALAKIATGGRVDVPVKYTVPVPAAKSSTETDADYRTRLGGSDGAMLAAPGAQEDPVSTARRAR